MRNLDAVQIEQFVGALKSWTNVNPAIKGIALLGSWATSRQHAEADMDVVLIVDDPDRFRSEATWMSEIDWPAAGLGPGRWTDCDYGRACSRHLKFADGCEVEVSFVDPGWASVDPVDPITRRITADGMRVVHDPSGLLGRLIVAL